MSGAWELKLYIRLHTLHYVMGWAGAWVLLAVVFAACAMPVSRARVHSRDARIVPNGKLREGVTRPRPIMFLTACPVPLPTDRTSSLCLRPNQQRGRHISRSSSTSSYGGYGRGRQAKSRGGRR